MQMAESRRGCTPSQQSTCSSNPLAFTSLFSAVAAELLISRHAPFNKLLFLIHKISFPTDSQELQRKSSKFLQKGWDSCIFDQYPSSLKKWRILQLTGSEIGTTNAL